MDTETTELFDQKLETSDSIKKYVHIIRPPENAEIFSYLERCGNPDPSAKDIFDFARTAGFEVVALCGYRWIPISTGENLDVCQICMDVAGMHMRNEGE